MSSIEQLTEGRIGVFLDTMREEVAEGVRMYWSVASKVLKDSGVNIRELPSELVSLRRNFFSVLFLYSYHRASVPRERRVFYAAVNHCLRGMVTGCDNLLDDEYKSTLLTDLPANATRFRSVLDIMVSDRVLFHLLADALGRGELRPEQVAKGCSESLRALARSGVQEAGEEGGVREIPEPRQVLESIHRFKTGLLFQSPWAIPRLIEPPREDGWAPILGALYNIGIGCQVMDDMVDMASDVRRRRYNYLVSVAWHGENDEERSLLGTVLEASNPASEGDEEAFEDQREGGQRRGVLGDRGGDAVVRHGRDGKQRLDADLALRFPSALRAASRTASSYLQQGLASLFGEDLNPFVKPAAAMLSELIGASRFMSHGDDSR